PTIIVTGQYTNLTVGSSVCINCTTVPSIPGSEIKWHSSSFNSDSNELIINPVMLSHDSKTFTCVVLSSLTKNVTVSVKDTYVSGVSIQPSLLYYDSNNDTDSNVTLLCNIELSHEIGLNISSLAVNWATSGMINSFDGYIEPITELSSTFNSILTLTQVSPTNAGVYTCKASIDGSHKEAKNDSVVLCLK
uniref:Ig-like domain-containing protein n=1 Tax=Amphimedon queenslandica TaxID=400682 RepID=A0A1X7SJP8_AMPQE